MTTTSSFMSTVPACVLRAVSSLRVNMLLIVISIVGRIAKAAPLALLLQERDRSLSAVGTDADDAALSVWTSRQFLHRLAQYPRARRAERVTECDAAAIRIHPLPREGSQRCIDPDLAAQEVRTFEGLDVEEELGGKGLVNFPQIDFGIGESVPRKQPRNRKCRRHQQAFDPEVD